MGKITHIADIKNDNSLLNPKQCLEDVIRRIDDGDIDPNKLVIIHLQTNPEGNYEWNTYKSNLRDSELIALLEIVAHYAKDNFR